MIYDISPPLSPALPVWPGDVPLRRLVPADRAADDPVTTSALHATVHLGAHADAPRHWNATGSAIDACDLDAYLGPCEVVRVPGTPGDVITPACLPDQLQAPRVLFATGSHPAPTEFKRDFAALSLALADALHQQGVKLVGLDTPSVDRFDDADLPVHHRLGRHGIAILEGLLLQDVPAGVYELIALPLRLVGFDASPVRAVLRTP